MGWPLFKSGHIDAMVVTILEQPVLARLRYVHCRLIFVQAVFSKTFYPITQKLGQIRKHINDSPNIVLLEPGEKMGVASSEDCHPLLIEKNTILTKTCMEPPTRKIFQTLNWLQ